MIGLHKNRCIFNEAAELLIGRDIQAHNFAPIHPILADLLFNFNFNFFLKFFFKLKKQKNFNGTLPVIGVRINLCIFNDTAAL